VNPAGTLVQSGKRFVGTDKTAVAVHLGKYRS
jgi:hypothetical protein